MAEPVTAHQLSMGIGMVMVISILVMVIQPDITIITICNGANNYFQSQLSLVVV